MDPFLGQIQPFGFNFAPRGWAFCAGQIMSIAQNNALFALLGTLYGGNGQSTFGLPDLRARSAVGFGDNVPGLNSFNIGEHGGTQTQTLTSSQMPTHTHTLHASDSPGTNPAPTANSYLGAVTGITKGGLYSSTAGNMIPLSNATGASGGNQSFSILNPFLAINFSIALEGTFPSRN